MGANADTLRYLPWVAGVCVCVCVAVCVISFQLFKQVEGLAKAESVCAPFKGGRKTSQSPSQLASRLLLLEHAECRSALTKPSFSQSQMK